MKNNINNYRKELTGYCKESIASATYNEWHFKYLQEKLKNEILRVRLKNCKEDNKQIKNRYISCIKFLLHDRQDKLKVRSMNDIVWDLDNSISLLMGDMLIRFTKNVQGIPKDFIDKYKDDEIAFNEWIKTINKMAQSFYLIHDKDFMDITEEENKTIQEGLNLFAKYFRDLWC